MRLIDDSGEQFFGTTAEFTEHWQGPQVHQAMPPMAGKPILVVQQTIETFRCGRGANRRVEHQVGNHRPGATGSARVKMPWASTAPLCEKSSGSSPSPSANSCSDKYARACTARPASPAAGVF